VNGSESLAATHRSYGSMQEREGEGDNERADRRTGEKKTLKKKGAE
jgi:hypothetical protein